MDTDLARGFYLMGDELLRNRLQKRSASKMNVSSRKSAVREARRQVRASMTNNLLHLGNVREKAREAAKGEGLNAHAVPERWHRIFVATFMHDARKLVERKRAKS